MEARVKDTDAAEEVVDETVEIERSRFGDSVAIEGGDN